MSDTQKNETVATEQPPAAPVSATEPGSAPASEKKQPFFTRRTVLAMTGCGVAGLVVGGVLASFVSGKSDCKVTALTSGGSQANVEDLTNGNVQLAFVQSDVMNYAYNGQRLFDSPVTGFSVVAQLYQEQVQIVTTNPDIKTVADLAGKKVSIGAAGSGVYFNAIDVLNAYDLKESDISAVYQSFGDSAESLKDGKIDAAFIVAGAPTTAITDLATAGSVYLVSLDDSHVQSLLAASPYYTAATIKAGTY